MSSYKPERRGVPVRILASPGWLAGRVHLPAKAYLMDFLDHVGPFLTLTEVELAADHQVPFLALQRSAIFAVVPPPSEEAPVGRETSLHPVSVLFGHHVVRGSLRTLPGVRVSDYLMHHSGYVRVESALLRDRQHPEREEERFPMVLLNADTIVGVAEVAEQISG